MSTALFPYVGPDREATLQHHVVATFNTWLLAFNIFLNSPIFNCWRSPCGVFHLQY